MREILFKGFYEDENGNEKAFYNGKWHSGIWVEGFLYYEESYQGSINFAYIINDVVETNCGLDIISDYAVGPETVCEYTGLTDKNGKKIFEGDIVECVSWNEFFSDGRGKPIEPFRRKMTIVFHNGAFMMKEILPPPVENNYWNIIYDGDVQIIGSIFDHPKLLQSEDKQ